MPFEGAGGKWQISTDGGTEPRWSGTGHELFYANGNSLVSVPYSVEKNRSRPVPCSLAHRLEMRAPFASYDVAPDGQHFVIFELPAAVAATSEPTVVLNWLDQARQLVVAGQTGTSNKTSVTSLSRTPVLYRFSPAGLPSAAFSWLRFGSYRPGGVTPTERHMHRLSEVLVHA